MCVIVVLEFLWYASSCGYAQVCASLISIKQRLGEKLEEHLPKPQDNMVWQLLLKHLQQFQLREEPLKNFCICLVERGYVIIRKMLDEGNKKDVEKSEVFKKQCILTLNALFQSFQHKSKKQQCTWLYGPGLSFVLNLNWLSSTDFSRVVFVFLETTASHYRSHCSVLWFIWYLMSADFQSSKKSISCLKQYFKLCWHYFQEERRALEESGERKGKFLFFKRSCCFKALKGRQRPTSFLTR